LIRVKIIHAESPALWLVAIVAIVAIALAHAWTRVPAA
jgi:hypothetical protein